MQVLAAPASDLTSNLAPVLSLADLDAFDERPQINGSERRYLCPLCGHDKPRDSAHRCLCANTASGLWNCKRCHADGKLREAWQPRQGQAEGQSKGPQARSAASQRRAHLSLCSAEVRARPKAPPLAEVPAGQGKKEWDWRADFAATVPLEETPGAKYLQGRGIPVEVAAAAGVRFSRRWLGAPAVVAPIYDLAGELVAAQGCRIHDGTKRTGGPKKLGAFFAPCITASGQAVGPLDTEAPAVIICEAPFDALSLAAAGFPALALCGCDAPEWLHLACGLKRVLLGLDADAKGDEAAARCAALLRPFTSRFERLRPEGGKDWNEVLQVLGLDWLTEWLRAGQLCRVRVVFPSAARLPSGAWKIEGEIYDHENALLLAAHTSGTTSGGLGLSFDAGQAYRDANPSAANGAASQEEPQVLGGKPTL